MSKPGPCTRRREHCRYRERMLERVGILYRDFYQTKQCFGFNDGALRCLEQLELEPRLGRLSLALNDAFCIRRVDISVFLSTRDAPREIVERPQRFGACACVVKRPHGSAHQQQQ
jgi:hypothetical protein